jgi:hypothetical protein
MAILYITEYVDLDRGPGGAVGQMGAEPAVASQVVSIGAGSVQSAAFNALTRFVRLHCDVACEVLFGTNPTVIKDASSRLAANQTEYRSVPYPSIPGFKVAVIAPTI